MEHLDKSEAPDRILIHDAARPFVSTELISAILHSLDDCVGAIPVVAIPDSVKTVDKGQITGAVDRSMLRQAQTPQGFHFAPIIEAHRQYKDVDVTDDAEIAALAGISLLAVPGEPQNIKITLPEDIAQLRLLERATYVTRMGTGFDVHRLGQGDHVMLGGVRIAHNQSLIGHSDADVALHALTDALLGAIGAGDIGQHFPPEDDRWKDAPSDQFLRHAVSLVQSAGGKVVNVDLTIICEAPNIAPHSDAMRGSIAHIMGVDVDCVSIKATTTERLGTTGDGTGIAAQAIAAVELPRERA